MADRVVDELAAAARAAGRFGIDTEFMGEGRYQALLCLVQVAVEEEGRGEEPRVEVLDPLEPGFDPGPLRELLADPEIEVVLHASRQDIAILRRTWETDVHGVFDTQLAAGFAGMRAQLGYEGLLHELLGVRLRKSASFTKWDRRPLSEEQVSYAREDVLHLLQATDVLQARLQERGRLGWAQEECRALESVSDERDADVLFAKLPRVNSLDPAQRAVARALVVWREQTAKEADRPAQGVLPDAALVELAKRRPRDQDRLGQIRGLPEGVLRRRGRQLLEVIEASRENEPIPVVGEKPPGIDPGDAPLIALGEALVRARVAEAELAYELVAARADLQRIVAAQRDGLPEPAVRTLEGWRRGLVGEELLELLDGRRSLRVGAGRRLDVQAVDG